MDKIALLRSTSLKPEKIDSQEISRERLHAILDAAVLSATGVTPDQLPKLRHKMNRRIGKILKINPTNASQLPASWRREE